MMRSTLAALLLFSTLAHAKPLTHEEAFGWAFTRKGQPHVGRRCPSALPCVYDSGDFAVYVTARGWSEYYVVDYGSRTLPLRSDGPNHEEMWRRISASVVAILEKKHADAFVVEAETAGKARLLVGLSDWNLFAVPEAPPDAAHAPQPINTTPEWAHQHYLQTWKRFSPEHADGKLFGDDELKAMARDTFEHPRVFAAQNWLASKVGSGPYVMRMLMVAAIYLPEGHGVFLVDNFDERPQKEFDHKRFALTSEDRIIRALQTLGIKQVEVPIDTISLLPRLTKTGGWLPGKLPLQNDIFQ
jgi:hypothetical protein